MEIGRRHKLYNLNLLEDSIKIERFEPLSVHDIFTKDETDFIPEVLQYTADEYQYLFSPTIYPEKATAADSLYAKKYLNTAGEMNEYNYIAKANQQTWAVGWASTTEEEFKVDIELTKDQTQVLVEANRKYNTSDASPEHVYYLLYEKGSDSDIAAQSLVDMNVGNDEYGAFLFNVGYISDSNAYAISTDSKDQPNEIAWNGIASLLFYDMKNFSDSGNYGIIYTNNKFPDLSLSPNRLIKTTRG